MKIAVIGTGAVGGYYGAKLVKAGYDVTFFGTEKSVEIIKDKGIYVNSVDGDIEIKEPKIFYDYETMKDMDLILLCTKAYHTEQIAKALKPNMSDKALVISLQNGVENESLLSEILGKENIIGASIYVFTSSESAGIITHKGSGSIILGELNGEITQRLQKLEKLFSDANIPTKTSASIMRDLWKKLFVNAAYNGITAVIGDSLKDINKIPEAKQAYYDILKECQLIANAEGMDIKDIEVDKIFDKLNQDNFMSVKSSTLQDIEKGKPVEIDSIQGAVVRIAKKHNLKAPLNNLIYSLIKLKTINFQL